MLPSWIAAQLPPGRRDASHDRDRWRAHARHASGARPTGRPSCSCTATRRGAFCGARSSRRSARGRAATSCARRARSRRARAVEQAAGRARTRSTHHAAWLGDALDQIAPGRRSCSSRRTGAGRSACAAMPARRGAAARASCSATPPSARRRAKFKPTLFHRLSQLPVVERRAVPRARVSARRAAPVAGRPPQIRGEVARAYRWPLRARAPIAPRRSRSRGWCRTRTRTRRSPSSRDARRCSCRRACRSRWCGARAIRSSAAVVHAPRAAAARRARDAHAGRSLPAGRGAGRARRRDRATSSRARRGHEPQQDRGSRSPPRTTGCASIRSCRSTSRGCRGARRAR